MTFSSTSAADGFLRFPRRWMSLPLSPGAKCLLMHFCGAADESGASWYSFGQIGAIIQRSRASVAGYVRELRDAGLIETERQRTANGFNYRLRIRILGWEDMLRAWRTKRAPSQRPVERCIRYAERKNPTGSEKEISETETPAGESDRPSPAHTTFGAEREAEWRRCAGDETGIGFASPPSAELLHAVLQEADRLNAVHDILEENDATDVAVTALRTLCSRRRLSADADGIASAAAVIGRRIRTRDGLRRAVARLDAEWPPHWRRLSTAEQIDRWLTDVLRADPRAFEDVGAVWRFRNRALRARWELARHSVRKGSDAGGQSIPSADRALSTRSTSIGLFTSQNGRPRASTSTQRTETPFSRNRSCSSPSMVSSGPGVQLE
jgi:hypothetical protein